MPWHVEKTDRCPASRPFGVLKDDDNEVEGCHRTRDAANAQLRALYSNELRMRAGAMADLIGVEIARIGTWQLASGSLEVTERMLLDAAEYANRPDARPAPVKIGHADPRFDGEPALGWLSNLRVEGSGKNAVLLGDVTGMPDWLARAAPSAWPDRSMEGWTDLEVDGRTYAMVVDGLALLGVTPPGMSTIRSLRDLPQALGVAASARIVANLVTAVSDKPWSQFTAADYTPEQWRRACLIDTGVGDAESKSRYKLPVREPGGALNRSAVHAAAAVLAGGRGGVDATAEQKEAARRKLRGLYRELGEEPPESLAASAGSGGTITKEGAGMDPAKIREALGLPADASDEDVRKAVVAAGLAPAATTQPEPAPPPTPPAPEPEKEPEEEGEKQPEAVAAAKKAVGTMTIDVAAWEAREADIKRLKAAQAKRDREERDSVINAAVKDGKFPPARVPHWVRLWDADPEGTRQVIASLARNVVPVTAMGYPGDPDEALDDEFAHLFPPAPSSSRGGLSHG